MVAASRDLAACGSSMIYGVIESKIVTIQSVFETESVAVYFIEFE